ncbi:unnamed protein product [Rhizophagus irregularis]|nr:unnamed protein product [Rhizophagus irregularis]
MLLIAILMYKVAQERKIGRLQKLVVIIISLFYLPDNKASELYNGRGLVGSQTFARMLLTAILRRQTYIMEGVLLGHGH